MLSAILPLVTTLLPSVVDLVEVLHKDKPKSGQAKKATVLGIFRPALADIAPDGTALDDLLESVGQAIDAYVGIKNAVGRMKAGEA